MLVIEHWTVTVLETVVYIYGILCYTDYIMKKKWQHTCISDKYKKTENCME